MCIVGGKVRGNVARGQATGREEKGIWWVRGRRRGLAIEESKAGGVCKTGCGVVRGGEGRS